LTSVGFSTEDICQFKKEYTFPFRASIYGAVRCITEGKDDAADRLGLIIQHPKTPPSMCVAASAILNSLPTCATTTAVVAAAAPAAAVVDDPADVVIVAAAPATAAAKPTSDTAVEDSVEPADKAAVSSAEVAESADEDADSSVEDVATKTESPAMSELIDMFIKKFADGVEPQLKTMAALVDKMERIASDILPKQIDTLSEITPSGQKTPLMNIFHKGRRS